MVTQKITQKYEILDNTAVSTVESMRDYFGYALAAKGKTLVVGAYGQDVMASLINKRRRHNDIVRNAGTAYIYEQQKSGNWLLVQTLTPPTPEGGGSFGKSVATDGKTVVIGMASKDAEAGEKNVGAVYIYEKENGTWKSEPTAVFSSAEEGSYYGHAVAVSGDTVVIGMPERDEGKSANVGGVYVSQRGYKSWQEPIMLDLPSKLAANQRLGRSVAIDGDLIAVGAPGHFQKLPGQGFVYERQKSGWGKPKLLKKPDFLNQQAFGRSVSVCEGRVLVGAPDDKQGWALLYARGEKGSWGEPEPLPLPPATGRSFARRVALDGKTAVVGASTQYASTGGKEAGRAYLYELKNGKWAAPIVMEPPNLDGNEARGYFGGAVGIAETAVIVGAPWQDPKKRKLAGRVFIHSQDDDGNWLVDTVEDDDNKAQPYYYDTATAWLNRLQNVLACIETTQEIADKMVEDLRLSARTVEDWYELTQINSLRVLLENLYAFGNVQVRESFAALTTVSRKAQKRRVVPTSTMRRVLSQMSTDLEIFQRALDQRQRVGDNQSSSQGRALLAADVVSAQAIKPARGFLLQNRNVRIITYLSEVMGVRVFPYDPEVILIGVPFASVAGAELNRDAGSMKQINWDFLMLPHEVGHFLYRFNTPKQKSLKVQIHEALDAHYATTKVKETPTWITNWLEEIFADVYGCLLAGPIAIFGLQDVLSDQSLEEIEEDNGHHPIPAIRPFVGSDILRRISEDDVWFNRGSKSAYNKLVFPNTPDRLDENWRAFLHHRYQEHFADLDNALFSVSNHEGGHDHYDDLGLGNQVKEKIAHGHQPFTELTLADIREQLHPVIDIMLEILSKHLFLMRDEFPWSKDATSLDGLHSTLSEGIPMPVEPFGKLPDPTLHEWEGGEPKARKTLDDSLDLWAHRGPEDVAGSK